MMRVGNRLKLLSVFFDLTVSLEQVIAGLLVPIEADLLQACERGRPLLEELPKRSRTHR